MNEQQTNKVALVDEVVGKLRYFSRLYGINSLFIVGGYCRSWYFGNEWEVNDIDVACAYEDQSTQFGMLFCSEVLRQPPTIYQRTNTVAVPYKSEFGEIKIEFQGKSPTAYMNNQEVREYLRLSGVADTPLMHNIYGRDFTINSMIYSLANDNFYDPTDRAVNDLERKSIVSLLPAELLLKYNPLAGLRAIRLSLLHDFRIESTLRHFIKKIRPDLLKSLSEDRIAREIMRILEVDPEKAIETLEQFGLQSFLMDKKLTELVHAQ